MTNHHHRPSTDRAPRGFSCLVGLATCALAGSAFVAPEARAEGGETPATALLVTDFPFEDTGDTSDNVDDFDVVCPFTGSVAPDVFYRIDADVPGRLRVDLCMGEYDTKTYVLDDGLMPVGCNDDLCSFYHPFASILEVDIEAGTHYIAVDGYGEESGPYLLGLDFTPTTEIECPPGATGEGEPCDDTGAIDTVNGGCNLVRPLFSNVACEDTVCGAGWALGGTRDTDWYLLETTDAEAQVTQVATAEFDLVMGFIPTSPLGVPDCSTVTVVEPVAFPSAGETGSITTPCLPAGAHLFFVAHDAFDLLPCGAGPPTGNDYVTTWSCTLPCPPEPCPDLGDLDGDGQVAFGDVLVLLVDFGPCP